MDAINNAIIRGGANALKDLNVNSIRRTSDLDEISAIIQLRDLRVFMYDYNTNVKPIDNIERILNEIDLKIASLISYNIKTY